MFSALALCHVHFICILHRSGTIIRWSPADSVTETPRGFAEHKAMSTDKILKATAGKSDRGKKSRYKL
jgi:hypothetical protein